MPLVKAQCTNCGAAIEVDSSKDAQICKYCGSAFIVEQAINNYNITNNVTNNIQAENVTIINQSVNQDFEIVAGKLFKYKGASADVIIPDTVIEIEREAFPDGVKTVTIPNSVTTIKEYAFYGCASLASIKIPNSVTTIKEYAFYGCASLASITIPNRITTINDFVFNGCTSLTSVTIPNSVTSINKFAFNNCSSLASITIPNSVTTIDKFAFCGCSSLSSVTIPNGVTTINDYAFYRCSNLSSVTILGKPHIVSSAFNDTPWTQQNQAKEKTGGCYIATCVYGSYDCPQVWTLRRYRDNILAETWYGRAFIHTYYAISPTIVKLFGDTKWFKKMWRGRLDRTVVKLQKKGVESTPYKDRNWNNAKVE